MYLLRSLGQIELFILKVYFLASFFLVYDMEKIGGDMSEFPEHVRMANLALIEELYGKYLADPKSVDPSWRHFFEGVDFGQFLTRKRGETSQSVAPDSRILDLIQAYRTHGHLLAMSNPLFSNEGRGVRELELSQFGFSGHDLDQLHPPFGLCGKNEAPLKEIIEALKGIYCSRIGFEYKGCPIELEKWMQERIEPQLKIEPAVEERKLILEYLNKAEVFESFLHTKYVGQTRFSLEGAETMIPLLAELITKGGDLGVEELIIGMAHRGRLNVLTNILNKPFTTIFEEFEDDTTLSFAGNDDVRYHMGFIGQMEVKEGRGVVVEMVANPSHLESVDPIVLGKTFAKQLLDKNGAKEKVVCLMIHGDASIAGQGVVYESLQLMKLPAYSVGGTLHLVVNNQIGYTTLPEEGRSTEYCTDIAKTFRCPVFHVNAEDPDSCLYAAKLAIEIRQKFQCDVFIDLICYRKYGHNEGDEPSFTQPLQYKMIRAKKSIRDIYHEQLVSEGHLDQGEVETLEEQFKEILSSNLAKAQENITAKRGGDPYKEVDLFKQIPTGVASEDLKEVIVTFCNVPQDFHPHPKLAKWIAGRLAEVEKNVDWPTAECLAFGSLLKQQIPIRLAGQDSQRGTFSQRHMVWVDAENKNGYSPLAQFQTRLQIINSPLTEYAGMGFEYGYSWAMGKGLLLWEAQYGDFDNGAQIIIDQYLVCAEQKWNTPSSLTLLLPHGYEGAGPEHSSARMERFLQLSAGNNVQVVNASTPSQYFHLLRRQALREVRKPLFVFTPKSLLRNPACVSPWQEFTTGSFQEILDDPKEIKNPKRLIFCTGKIFYELFAARSTEDVAIIRIEQVYPLHIAKIKDLLGKYKGFTEVVWVQEEAENMGAWNFIRPHLQEVVGMRIFHVSRPENPTTATGSNRKHKQEQKLLLERAFGEL